MCVGTRIKQYLMNSGISQSYVSEKSGIPPAKLNLSLNGKRRLTFEEYEVICGVLSVEAGRFLCPRLPDAGQENV